MAKQKHDKLNQTTLLEVIIKEFEGRQFSFKMVLNVLKENYKEFHHTNKVFAILTVLEDKNKIEQVKEGKYKVMVKSNNIISKSIVSSTNGNLLGIFSKRVKENVSDSASESKLADRAFKKKAIDISGAIFDEINETITRKLNKTKFKGHKLNVTNVSATVEAELDKLEDKLSNAIFTNIEKIENFE